MALDLGELKFKVKADTADAEKQVSSFSSNLKKAGENFSSIGESLTKKVTAPIIALGTIAVKTASDVNENLNKMESVYGKNADAVEKWSEASSKQYGISKNDFLDYVSTYGALSQDLLKQTTAQSKDTAKSMVQRAADISSYYNMTMDESNSLMQQLYSGETDGWKRLGITINDTTMQEYAHSKGINKTIASMSLQEKTQLRIDMAMDKTNRTQGDFTKTSDGLANSSRILKAQLSDLAATVGTVLLPPIQKIVANISQILSKAIEWGNANPALMQQIVQFGLALAAVGPILLGVGKAIEITTSLGGVMATVFSPVGLIMVGIIAIIAALALAWSQDLGGIRESTETAMNTVKQTFVTVMPQLQKLFGDLWTFCKQIWVQVGQPVFEVIGQVINILAGIFKAVFPTIVNIVTLAFDVIKTIWNLVLYPVFKVFIEIIKNVLSVVQENLPAIQAIFENAFGVIQNIWEVILKPVLETLVEKIGWVYTQAKPVLDGIKTIFNDCFGWIVNLIKDATGWLNDFLSLFNKNQSKLNQASGSTSTATKYSGAQMFADGGILTQASVFGFSNNKPLVGGEAGAEAVIPLAKLPEMLQQMNGKGAGSVTVNNYSPKALSEAETAKAYKKAQRDLAFGF